MNQQPKDKPPIIAINAELTFKQRLFCCNSFKQLNHEHHNEIRSSSQKQPPNTPTSMQKAVTFFEQEIAVEVEEPKKI